MTPDWHGLCYGSRQLDLALLVKTIHNLCQRPEATEVDGERYILQTHEGLCAFLPWLSEGRVR